MSIEDYPLNKRDTVPPYSPDKKAHSSSPLPKKIGPYPIEALFEQGGMSILYIGRDPLTDESIIIKVLSERFLKNPEAIEHFLKEAKVISLANHPNIIKLYGFGEWEKGLYIAMEFIEGVSLKTYMQHNPLPVSRIVEIILEIAYALVHLHTHQVIHRDLKPENILITHNGQIKVIDFGIAQLLYEKKHQKKARFLGTPIYISPEQREDPDKVSYPSDLYSLGIIAYELLIGKFSHGQIVLSLIPKGLQQIIGKALKPNPAERYHDIVDFISDLAVYLHSGDIEKQKKGMQAFIENLRNVYDYSLISLQPSIQDKFAYSLSSKYIYPLIMWIGHSSDNKFRFVLLENTKRDKNTFLEYLELKGFLNSNLNDPLDKFISKINMYLATKLKSSYAGTVIDFHNDGGEGVVWGDLKLTDKKGNILIQSKNLFGNNPEATFQIGSFSTHDQIFLHCLKNNFSIDVQNTFIQKRIGDMLRTLKLQDADFVEERSPYIFAFFGSK